MACDGSAIIIISPLQAAHQLGGGDELGDFQGVILCQARGAYGGVGGLALSGAPAGGPAAASGGGQQAA